MKTKKVIDSKFQTLERPELMANKKPKSLRPMRSMVAVRSLKSKTTVAAFATQQGSAVERN